MLLRNAIIQRNNFEEEPPDVTYFVINGCNLAVSNFFEIFCHRYTFHYKNIAQSTTSKKSALFSQSLDSIPYTSKRWCESCQKGRFIIHARLPLRIFANTKHIRISLWCLDECTRHAFKHFWILGDFLLLNLIYRYVG